MKSGFILIEVLIATAIGAVLSGLMLTSLYQTMQYQAAVNNTTSLYMRAIVCNQQFERDISGAFVPQQALEMKRTTTISQPDQKESEKPKKLEQVFHSVIQDANTSELTFITRNPMQAYWGSETGKPQPRIARVVYRLVPDKDTQGSFMLMRQEGASLDFKEYAANSTHAPRSYMIIDGVKSLKMSFTYTAPLEKKEGTSGKAEQEEVITLTSWTSEPKKEEKEKQKQPIIPSTVDVVLTLWNDDHTREESFTFSYSIVEFPNPPEKPPLQPKPEASKPESEKKPSQPELNGKPNANSASSHQNKALSGRPLGRRPFTISSTRNPETRNKRS